MYEYTISKKFDNEAFSTACQRIEEHYPDCTKKRLLIDVDGTAIQRYDHLGKKIEVFNDYMVGAVYIESAVNLAKIFGEYRMN